jgi:hypothetical protein
MTPSRTAPAHVIFSITLATVGCASLVRPVAPRFEPRATGVSRGIERFAFDDFGILDPRYGSTGTLPWKLAATALVLREAPRLGLPSDDRAIGPVLEQFGLSAPDSIANWPDDAGSPPPSGTTIGQTRGIGHSRILGLEVELRGPGCLMCHSGVLYDATGRPTKSAWLGLPNTWLNLDELNLAIPIAIRAAMGDETRLLKALRAVFPGVTERELRTYKRVVLPRVRSRLAATSPESDRLLPFDNGGAGTVNNVAARLIAAGEKPDWSFRERQSGIVSPPILTNRAFRSSLMWDGSYVIPGSERFVPITRKEAESQGAARHAGLMTVFSIGEAGRRPAKAPLNLGSFREVALALDSLKPPAFPGRVDASLAAQGSKVFARRCSTCHGDYERRSDDGRPILQRFPNRLITLDEIGTDPERALLVEGAVSAMRRSERGRPLFRYAQVEPTQGYVAPILDGLWATAPYLHNGSVPTLWDLMHPEERPTSFEVGGHWLDYERMGIAIERTPDPTRGDPSDRGRLRLPASWHSLSRRSVYDTRLKGRSNAGHEFPFNQMHESDKHAVMEFLKLL